MKLPIMLFALIISTLSFASGECTIKAYKNRFSVFGDKINFFPELHSTLTKKSTATECLNSAQELKLEILKKFQQQDFTFASDYFSHMNIKFSGGGEKIKALIR